MKHFGIAAFTALVLGSLAFAQEDSVQNVLTDESKKAFDEEKSYSPYAGRSTTLFPAAFHVAHLCGSVQGNSHRPSWSGRTIVDTENIDPVMPMERVIRRWTCQS